MPKKPSISKEDGIPDPPEKEELDLKKPKSRIFINENEPAKPGELDSIDKMFEESIKNKNK